MKVAVALLCLAMPVVARTPHSTPKATPTPVVAQPLDAPVVTPAPAVPGVLARQRTAQEDAELKDWITGIMTTAQDAEKRADQAEAEAKSSRDQGAIAVSRLMQADAQLAEIQKQYDSLQQQVDDLKEQIKKDAIKLKRFYKLVTVLSVIAASLAALAVFLMMKPGGIIGTLASFTSPMLYGAPVVVWLLVFAAAQVYLRYIF